MHARFHLLSFAVLIALFVGPMAYADDSNVKQEQVAKFRIGFDISYGATEGAEDIPYGITDFYSDTKNSIYRYDDVIGFEMAAALRFVRFESEAFIDYISGDNQNAPDYYNYISYPMDAIGTIVNLGVREHYYLPVFSWLDLDIGAGIGWGFNYGDFIDEERIESYRQETWSKNSAFYDINLGVVLNWTQKLSSRVGYRRTVYLSNDFGIKATNQGYAGFSYTF